MDNNLPIDSHSINQKYFDTLDKTSKSNRSNIVKFCAKILGKLKLDILKTSDVLFTQEHLEHQKGSETSIFSNSIRSALKNIDNPSEGCKKLNQMLKKSSLAPFSYLKRIGNRKMWINKQYNKILELPPNQSLLLDASSKPGEHAMLLEIKRESTGNYSVFFFNTGAGLENEKFHPQTTSESGKSVHQICAVFRDISTDPSGTLSKKFLNDLFKAIDIKPKASNTPSLDENATSYATTEDTVTINNIYDKLGQLGTPENLVSDYENNKHLFRKPQIGTSCAPSVMWALAKSKLSPSEMVQIKQDIRFQSLTKNYKAYKNGWDQSSTCKIHILEQVKKLMGVRKKYNQKESSLLNNIRIEMKDASQNYKSIKCVKAEKALNEPFKNNSNKEFSLPFLDIDLDHLNANIKMGTKTTIKANELETDSPHTFKIINGSIEPNEPKNPTARIHLLYLYLLAGDEKNSAIPARMLTKIIRSGASLSKANQFTDNLDALSQIIFISNPSRESCAKSEFIHHLIGDITGKLDNPNDRFNQLHVPFYLEDDNVWITGINTIQVKYQTT